MNLREQVRNAGEVEKDVGQVMMMAAKKENKIGKRQDPDGAYAAVMPKWISSILKGEPVYIDDEGKTNSNFCYINNAVRINILAASVDNDAATNQVHNVAAGDRTSLNELYKAIIGELAGHIKRKRVPHHTIALMTCGIPSPILARLMIY